MLHRLLEIILGLPKDFLVQQGSYHPNFRPDWPLQSIVGAATWNVALGGLGIWLILHVYRRESRKRGARIILGILRTLLLLFTLAMLNNPVLTLERKNYEPSVLAVLIHDSISMKVRDMTGPGGQPISRLDAVKQLLTKDDARLLSDLAKTHTIRLYDFSRSHSQIASIDGPAGPEKPDVNAPANPSVQTATDAILNLEPTGESTQIVSAVHSVLEDLQGQRLAGIVIFTDGRETPSAAPPEAVAAVKAFGVNIYPVAVGTDKPVQNVAVDSVDYEPAGFVGDYSNFRVTVHASGYSYPHPVTLTLMRPTGGGNLVPITDENGAPISRTVSAGDSNPFTADLQYKLTAADMPTVHLMIDALPQPGELDESDNLFPVQLDALDQNINVLYVDGYPRWDYRYLKTSMIRDRTVKISCLLTSADPAFKQEASDDPKTNWRITEFPRTMETLMRYDVVVFGDVDPRQFTDAQLQMVSDFVSKKGGGFDMVAGPRWSPQSFRNTPIEAILPVNISRTEPDDSHTPIAEGFRLAITKAGEDSSMFRFFQDRAANEKFVQNDLQELFWYCHGVTVKPGVGIALAEHPSDQGPDGHKAPILVAGQFGAGRTIFSAIDDSWRWRFYTGESVFNTYWVQQLRFLARGRKVGQRKLTAASDQSVYQAGDQVTLTVKILSTDLPQLSGPLDVEVDDETTGQPVRHVDLSPSEAAKDVYSGSYTADKLGSFIAHGRIGTEPIDMEYRVKTPQLELVKPQVDIAALSRLATEAPVSFGDARSVLMHIRDVSRITPDPTAQSLWDAPLALILFVGLIVVEWVLRKMYGML